MPRHLVPELPSEGLGSRGEQPLQPGAPGARTGPRGGRQVEPTKLGWPTHPHSASDSQANSVGRLLPFQLRGSHVDNAAEGLPRLGHAPGCLPRGMLLGASWLTRGVGGTLLAQGPSQGSTENPGSEPPWLTPAPLLASVDSLICKLAANALEQRRRPHCPQRPSDEGDENGRGTQAASQEHRAAAAARR